MLGTIIFSSAHNVFYPSPQKIQLFGALYFIVCKGLNLDQSKIMMFGKELIWLV